ncbi:MAG TPA: putative DNA binding domain-containing protein [Paenalcaligenes hominis]|uniref:DNA binding domain-containing protein n=1 Tax=Paenalcaligenes hominis TaxID=643674 RepID=A0A9D3ACA9_9BURK|nr:putative DNA binding domain-containing protein [Paenalcaligenes hominis]
MRTIAQIKELLLELEHCIADDLEDQDLDFKQWDTKSRDKAVRTIVQMAVCMANGGGGTVVFGVSDRVMGQEKAILGVPLEVDINVLKKAVYDQTDPKIMPVFEEFTVQQGTGRILLMQIHPGLPPYTDSSGRGTIRIGKDCQPLTGTLRSKISIETGDTDYTAETISPMNPRLFSPTAMETLRNLAKSERAPEDLLQLSDEDLLNTLGLIRNGEITRAAILLAGTEEALREHLPGYGWTFLQMTTDTAYGIREDKVSSLPLSVKRIEELLVPFNPITTVEHGLFHYEYRTWPTIALREALMNAFCHRDLRLSGPVMVKLYSNRIEISSNGGFIGGISPDNILHHQPVARNPLLVEALTRLRLVNRTNLGISRMFSTMLMEGKEPPVIRESGESVTVVFFRRELNPAFRVFVTEESTAGRDLGVDSLIILQYLLQHPELDIATAAKLCQRREAEVRETVSVLEQRGYIEHGGVGRGTYWTMHPDLYNRLSDDDQGEARRRIDWEAAKTRVLSILVERSRRGEQGMSNQEIRQVTRFDRNQVRRLMQELQHENQRLKQLGERRWTRYEYSIKDEH